MVGDAFDWVVHLKTGVFENVSEESNMDYSDSVGWVVSDVTPDGSIHSLAISNQLLYVVSQTGIVSARDRLDLSEISRSCFASKRILEVSTLAFDSERMVTAHRDNKIRVWSRATTSGGTGRLQLKHVATLPGVKEYMKNWAWKRDYVQVRRHHKRPWMEHSDRISALTFGQERLLYTASWDKTVKVWNLNTMKCEESFKGHDDAVNAMVFGKEEGVLYTGSADGTIKGWQRRRRLRNRHAMVVALQGQGSAVNALELGEWRLYSGGSDGEIKVWKRSSRVDEIEMEERLEGGHRRAVLGLEVVQGQWVLVSGSADRSVRVWRRQGNRRHRCVAVLEGHRGPVKSVRACMAQQSGSLCLVYSGALDGCVRMWLLHLNDDEDATVAPNTAHEIVHHFQSWWWHSAALSPNQITRIAPPL